MVVPRASLRFHEKFSIIAYNAKHNSLVEPSKLIKLHTQHERMISVPPRKRNKAKRSTVSTSVGAFFRLLFKFKPFLSSRSLKRFVRLSSDSRLDGRTQKRMAKTTVIKSFINRGSFELCTKCQDITVSSMYVWGSHISKSKDQSGEVANPARGQLNREN